LKRFLLPFLLLGYFSSFSQSILDLKLNGSEKGKTLPAFLQEIEASNEVKFYYITDWIQSISFTESFENRTLREALNELFLGTDLNYIESNRYAIIVVKDPTQALQRNAMINAAVREKKKIETIIIGEASTSKLRQRVSIAGIVLDGKSRDPLVGVNVLVGDVQTGTVTNGEGKFELKVASGKHVINFSYVNFEEKVIDLEIYKDGSLSIILEETPTVLDEVIIQDKAAREITTNLMGQTQLSMREIKRAPALLGEVDLIKQIQTLPGVSTAGEAASGFNVRGGSVDQNLILYDGLPVFNSSHVFGFFSTFNTEAIRDVSFYRGGIPAEFGGRVSSVLDIRSKEGDYEKWGVNGGIGIISSNLTVGGPIKRDKTSIIASFRTTYSDWLINTVKSNYVNLQNSSVSFYDGSIKLAHKFTDKTKLTWSGYVSNDQFKLSGDSTYKWDNVLTSLKIDHVFSNSFNASFMAGYGSYSYDVFDKNPLNGFDLTYKISYPTAKLDFHLARGMHKITFGSQGQYYYFNPGKLTPSSDESNKKFIEMASQKSLESGIYLADQFEVGRKIHVDAGIRLSNFISIGPADVNVYRSGVPRETLTLTDTIHYSNGQKIKSYYGLEPRLGLRYELSPNASIKIGYNRNFQYLHLITNTTAITPVDIWQPSNYYFRPQLADQLSVGYFRNFKEKKYEAFVEVYYKKIANVLDFKDGAQLLLNPQLETDLLQGKARSYGVEFQIAKSVGRLSGSLNYTYARSFRTISGNSPEETINNGKEYRSNFDQPHVVNLNWKYSISRRYFFTGGFTYHTGRPITLPVSAFTVGNITVSSFSDRNQFRIPDYHRLDLGLVFEGNHKRKKILDGTWTFSVYNVYARKNPYSVFFKEARPGILRPYRLAIIGTALPSLSYSFKI
jgi:hypothetical protein